MTEEQIIWIVDTSSVIQVRRSIESTRQADVFARMGKLVDDGRLVFPKQVETELGRFASPKSPDTQYAWAKQHSPKATECQPTLEEVRKVLAVVPTVLDPEKEAGVEEADPYVLATAVRMRGEGKDARVVTEEVRYTPSKTPLSAAAGMLGVPSVPLRAFLQIEHIV